MVVAHRLLKNGIDSREYILMTQGFLSQAFDGTENYSLSWTEHNEEIDIIGKVACHFTLLDSKQLPSPQ
jgi:hypothetical protein